MPELEDRVREWVDAAGAGVSPVTVEEVRARVDAQPGRRRWNGIQLAAAVLVVAGLAVGLVQLLPSDGDGEGLATDRPDRAEVSFTVLGRTEDSSGLPRGLQSVSGREGLVALWSGAGLEQPVPTVDFSNDAVVAITTGDDLCPPSLERFRRDGVELAPVFHEPPGPCRQSEVDRTFVVALGLASTGPSFRLVLPAGTVDGEGALVLDVGRPAPSGAGVPAVWPVAAVETDRSSPEAAVRSFLASLLGSEDAASAAVTADPEAALDGPVPVDARLGRARTRILAAPTPHGWVVLQAGDTPLSISPDPPLARIPAVDGAITVSVRVITDLGAAVAVERTTLSPSLIDLPPGAVDSIVAVHRALDGSIVALDAGTF